MDDKQLQIYQLLYQAYADEIKNLWQRSIFLASFMVLVWTGYGVLQLKALDKDFSVSAGYCFISFGLCGVIIILSLLWVAMAKGSKFVQEAHEEHIKSFEFNNAKIKQLFCDLDKYEYTENNATNSELSSTTQENNAEKVMNSKLKPSLFFCWGTTQAYRYSPNKINIALGWASCFFAFILMSYHIGFALSIKNCGYIVFIAVILIIGILITTQFIAYFLKGGDKDKNTNLSKFLNYLIIKGDKTKD